MLKSIYGSLYDKFIVQWIYYESAKRGISGEKKIH